jgi:outer membrane protein TolC
MLLFWFQLATAATLDAFLASAVEHNADLAVAEAQAAQSSAAVAIARSALLPSLSGTATYSLNQREVIATLPDGAGGTRSLTITPKNQVDGTVRLTVPLLAGAGVAQTAAAAARRDGGEASLAGARDQILVQVIQAYYDALVATRADEAAAASLAAAEQTLAIARARHEVAATGLLDLKRAEADHARARQSRIAAGQLRADASRTLKTISGLDASPQSAEPRAIPSGDLVVTALERNVSVITARTNVRAAKATQAAAVWAYAPVISGFAQERVTNATGFVGGAANWQAGAQLNWTLLDGFGREARISQASAALREAEARLLDTELTVGDQVASARESVDSAAAALDAAKAGAAASEVAHQIAEARFEAGDLDAAQIAVARRDALDAAVNLARAEANRAMAVERLRLVIGEPVR